jgi:hypothetical protein
LPAGPSPNVLFRRRAHLILPVPHWPAIHPKSLPRQLAHYISPVPYPKSLPRRCSSLLHRWWSHFGPVSHSLARPVHCYRPSPFPAGCLPSTETPPASNVNAETTLSLNGHGTIFIAITITPYVHALKRTVSPKLKEQCDCEVESTTTLGVCRPTMQSKWTNYLVGHHQYGRQAINMWRVAIRRITIDN